MVAVKMKNKLLLNMFLLFVVLLLAVQGMGGENKHVSEVKQGQKVHGRSDKASIVNKNKESYPETPEGVVEAGIRAVFDLNLNPESVEEFVSNMTVEEQKKYYTRSAFLVDFPGPDTVPVVLNFKILSSKISNDNAIVHVNFHYLGYSGIEEMEIAEKINEEIFTLKKEDGMWKISSPRTINVSILSAIQILKYSMSLLPDKNKQISKNIMELQKILKERK